MGFNPDGGGGIAGASDVAFNSLQNKQVLTYDNTSSKWQNSAIPSSGAIPIVTFEDLESQPDGQYFVVDQPQVTVTSLGQFQSSSSSTSGIITLNSALSVGDTVVVSVHCEGTGVLLSVSDSTGQTWSSGTTSQTSTSPHSQARMYVAAIQTPMQSGDTITVARSSNGGLGAHAAQVQGVQVAIVNDAVAEASANPIAYPVVTAAEFEAVFFAYSITGSAIIGATTGATVLSAGAAVGSATRQNGLAWKLATTTGSLSPTTATDITQQWSAASLGLASG